MENILLSLVSCLHCQLQTGLHLVGIEASFTLTKELLRLELFPLKYSQGL